MENPVIPPPYGLHMEVSLSSSSSSSPICSAVLNVEESFVTVHAMSFLQHASDNHFFTFSTKPFFLCRFYMPSDRNVESCTRGIFTVVIIMIGRSSLFFSLSLTQTQKCRSAFVYVRVYMHISVSVIPSELFTPGPLGTFK